MLTTAQLSQNIETMVINGKPAIDCSIPELRVWLKAESNRTREDRDEAILDYTTALAIYFDKVEQASTAAKVEALHDLGLPEDFEELDKEEAFGLLLNNERYPYLEPVPEDEKGKREAVEAAIDIAKGMARLTVQNNPHTIEDFKNRDVINEIVARVNSVNVDQPSDLITFSLHEEAVIPSGYKPAADLSLLSGRSDDYKDIAVSFHFINYLDKKDIAKFKADHGMADARMNAYKSFQQKWEETKSDDERVDLAVDTVIQFLGRAASSDERKKIIKEVVSDSGTLVRDGLFQWTQKHILRPSQISLLQAWGSTPNLREKFGISEEEAMAVNTDKIQRVFNAPLTSFIMDNSGVERTHGALYKKIIDNINHEEITIGDRTVKLSTASVNELEEWIKYPPALNLPKEQTIIMELSVIGAYLDRLDKAVSTSFSEATKKFDFYRGYDPKQIYESLTELMGSGALSELPNTIRFSVQQMRELLGAGEMNEATKKQWALTKELLDGVIRLQTLEGMMEKLDKPHDGSFFDLPSLSDMANRATLLLKGEVEPGDFLKSLSISGINQTIEGGYYFIEGDMFWGDRSFAFQKILGESHPLWSVQKEKLSEIVLDTGLFNRNFDLVKGMAEWWDENDVDGKLELLARTLFVHKGDGGESVEEIKEKIQKELEATGVDPAVILDGAIGFMQNRLLNDHQKAVLWSVKSNDRLSKAFGVESLEHPAIYQGAPLLERAIDKAMGVEKSIGVVGPLPEFRESSPREKPEKGKNLDDGIKYGRHVDPDNRDEKRIYKEMKALAFKLGLTNSEDFANYWERVLEELRANQAKKTAVGQVKLSAGNRANKIDGMGEFLENEHTVYKGIAPSTTKVFYYKHGLMAADEWNEKSKDEFLSSLKIAKKNLGSDKTNKIIEDVLASYARHPGFESIKAVIDDFRANGEEPTATDYDLIHEEGLGVIKREYALVAKYNQSGDNARSFFLKAQDEEVLRKHFGAVVAQMAIPFNLSPLSSLDPEEKVDIENTLKEILDVYNQNRLETGEITKVGVKKVVTLWDELNQKHNSEIISQYFREKPKNGIEAPDNAYERAIAEAAKNLDMAITSKGVFNGKAANIWVGAERDVHLLSPEYLKTLPGYETILPHYKEARGGLELIEKEKAMEILDFIDKAETVKHTQLKRVGVPAGFNEWLGKLKSMGVDPYHYSKTPHYITPMSFEINFLEKLKGQNLQELEAFMKKYKGILKDPNVALEIKHEYDMAKKTIEKYKKEQKKNEVKGVGG